MPTRTNRLQQTFGTAGAGHGTGVATTGAFTPSSNSLLVVVVYGTAETDSGMEGSDLTLTDSIGLTYTSRVVSTSSPGWSYGIRVWTAPVTTGVSMTLSADCGAFDMRGYRVEAYDYTSYDTTTPVGTTGTNTDADGNGAGTLTLLASPLSSSLVLAAANVVMSDNIGTEDITPGTGWTELFDSTIEGWGVYESEERGTSTSTSVDWVDLNAGTSTAAGGTMVALEIRDVSAAVPAITSVVPNPFVNGSTGIVISGSAFEAVQGTGSVRISPTDNIGDGGIVTQTVTAWSATSITFTAVRGGLTEGVNVYLFVTNNSGSSNAAGFVVQLTVTGKVAWLRA